MDSNQIKIHRDSSFKNYYYDAHDPTGITKDKKFVGQKQTNKKIDFHQAAMDINKYVNATYNKGKSEKISKYIK